MSAPTQSADTGKPPRSGKRSHSWLAVRINPFLLLALIFIPVMAWQWYDTRDQIAGLQHELAKRLAESDASGKESRNVAVEATEAGRRIETKVNLLEAKLAESQSQQLALEALYQELTRNRDEATLEEIEQLLLIANQQLQLASTLKLLSSQCRKPMRGCSALTVPSYPHYAKFSRRTWIF
jgi:uroporphyrin-3 C-methyltransferase